MFIIILLYLFINYFKGFFKPKTKVVYKNNDFIIIDKRYDFKINSNNKNEETVQTFMKGKYPKLANKGLVHEYYFVHRLDYSTSGLMCIPTNKTACQKISDAFSKRLTRKYYIALVRGLFSQDLANVNVPIGQDLRYREVEKMCTSNLKYCIKPRDARTVFIVLEYGMYDNYPCTKVLIRPVTGRRHQIRVHCNYLGHTIVGDYTYSNKKDVEPYRMFLNSTRLNFPFDTENYDFLIEYTFTKDWESIKMVNKFTKATFEMLDKFTENDNM